MGKYGNSWGPAGTWGILLILAVLIGAPLFTIFQTAFESGGAVESGGADPYMGRRK